MFLKKRSFLFIWGVYSGTYIVANCTQAICEYYEKSSFYPKFFASSVSLISLTLYKDKAFSRMFGVGEVKKFPIKSYGLLATRDSMTILAAFSLPGLISPIMQKNWGMSPLFAENTA